MPPSLAARVANGHRARAGPCRAKGRDIVSKSKINPVIIILMTVLLDSWGLYHDPDARVFKSVLPNSTTADASVWAGIGLDFALMQFLFGPLRAPCLIGWDANL